MSFEPIQNGLLIDTDKVIAIKTMKRGGKESIVLMTDNKDFPVDDDKTCVVKKILEQKKMDKKQFFGG